MDWKFAALVAWGVLMFFAEAMSGSTVAYATPLIGIAFALVIVMLWWNGRAIPIKVIGP